MEKILEIKDLTMIHGKNQQKAIALLEENKTNQEIFQATNCIVTVKHVSFYVLQGEIFVIMGLSGSGKSTLLKCINRLNHSSSGQIFVDGENILDYDKNKLRAYRHHKVGMVFQEFGLFDHRTVLENVTFGLEISHVPAKIRKEKAMNMLDFLGLKGWENQPVSQLSGGMKQRVGLARALVHDPEILLLDEPFSALDPLIRRQLQEELKRIHQQLKKTILFITHDINEAFYLGDHISIMKDGVMEQIGTPIQILQHPATDYVYRFCKDVNKLKIITAGHIMQNLAQTANTPKQWDKSQTVQQNQSLEEILLPLLQNHQQLLVANEKQERVGIIQKSDVLRLLAQ